MRIILTLFPCLMLIGLATCLPGEEPEGARKTTAEEVQEILDSVSNWGRWGEDDELGTLNLITPRRRRQAASLVRAGVSISMAHDVIKERMDGSSPFVLELMVNAVSGGVGGAGDRYSVQYHGFTQTHLDALFHIFYQGKTYNGYSADQILTSGSGQLSINRVRNGIFTRAVLMDIPALLGVYIPVPWLHCGCTISRPRGSPNGFHRIPWIPKVSV